MFTAFKLATSAFLSKYKKSLIIGGVVLVVFSTMIAYIYILRSDVSSLEKDLTKAIFLKDQYAAEVSNLESMIDKFKADNAAYQKQNRELVKKYSELDRKYTNLLADAEREISENPDQVEVEINEDFKRISKQIRCVTGGVKCEQ